MAHAVVQPEEREMMMTTDAGIPYLKAENKRLNRIADLLHKHKTNLVEQTGVASTTLQVAKSKIARNLSDTAVVEENRQKALIAEQQVNDLSKQIKETADEISRVYVDIKHIDRRLDAYRMIIEALTILGTDLDSLVGLQIYSEDFLRENYPSLLKVEETGMRPLYKPADWAQKIIEKNEKKK